MDWKNTCVIYDNAPNSQSHKEPCLNGWEYFASNQGMIIDSSWPKCFHKLGICCEKSCFVSIYSFHIFKSCSLIHMSCWFGEYLCSLYLLKTKGGAEKGTYSCETLIPSSGFTFSYPEIAVIACSVPQFGRWTCLVTPILKLCPNQ